jgi:flagellar protein FlaG
MSGVSASTLVIFIATVLVAAGVAGTLVTTVGDISNSAETQGDAITESIDSEIELLNDGGGSGFYTESDDGSTANITVYVRNTGSTTLSKDESELDVLVNGLFVPSEDLNITSMNGDDDIAAWEEDEVIEIVIVLGDPLSGSGNRLTVSPQGTERSLEFNADV